MSELRDCFVWYELVSTDCAAGADFYRSVVGWDLDTSSAPNAIFRIGSERIADLHDLHSTSLPSSSKSLWLGCVGVQSVEASVAAFMKAGGSLCGRARTARSADGSAIVADAEGAVLKLSEVGERTRPTPAPRGTPGHFSWRELHSSNQRAALSFYTESFDWSRGRAVDLGPLGAYQQFSIGSQSVGGMMTVRPEIAKPSWLYYINVGSIDETADKVQRAGGTILSNPTEKPSGDVSLIANDPQGAIFALVEIRS